MSVIFGYLKFWAYGAGVLALAVAAFFIRKSGADAERVKTAKSDMKAASTIGEARAAAKSASDDDLKKGIDKWTRP